MREFSIQEQNEAASPKDIAQLRWQAVEAFNTIPGLSPMARRVGIALVCIMDTKTRACFPSQQRLSDTLQAGLTSIKRAKQELKEAGLLVWFNPGGPRHLSRYMFNWMKLQRLSEGVRSHAREQASQRRSKRDSALQEPTWGDDEIDTSAEPIGAKDGPNGQDKEQTDNSSLGPFRCGIRANPDPQGPILVPGLGPSLGPELSHELTQCRTRLAQHDKTEGVTPLLQVARPKRRSCPFPSLLRQWEGNEEMLALIERLSFDDLGIASAMLASPKKGALEAEAFIRRKAPKAA